MSFLSEFIKNSGSKRSAIKCVDYEIKSVTMQIRQLLTFYRGEDIGEKMDTLQEDYNSLSTLKNTIQTQYA